MDTPQLGQEPNAGRRLSPWSVGRVCLVPLLLYGLSFACAWWLTPIETYATLNLLGENALFLFSADGSMLVTCSTAPRGPWRKGPLRVWDVASGQERLSIAEGWEPIEGVQFSPDSRLVAAYQRNGDLKVWDTQTHVEIANLRPSRVSLPLRSWLRFKFSPDARFLAVESQNQCWPDKHYIAFWNTVSGQEECCVEGVIDSLRFAPNGKSFATCQYGKVSIVADVHLWSIDKGAILVRRHTVTSQHLDISPDLVTFVTADQLENGIGQIAIWDMMTGESAGPASLMDLARICGRFRSSPKVRHCLLSVQTNILGTGVSEQCCGT